ncbi:substrate-binding domain-containing protein [Streptomyces sp. NPDC051041]|uniref:substrate-binding domain-containing protein n=1 Tax=Streptomyces sp. NPDC051041 TaxID=3365640 RepID=UPI00379AB91C
MNRALLVGVSEYDDTKPPHGVSGDLPAVRHNLDRLREVLARGQVFGAHEIVVKHSPSLDDFGRALQKAAAEADGVLLLYFAGHGAVPNAPDELFLQMRNASVIAGGEAVFPGAERFLTVLTVLATSRAGRIVVILDCCYAGNAARIWETFRDKRRVLLLMSVQANHKIDAGDPDTPTPFTGELVRLLAEDGELWFSGLADELRERMAAGGHVTVRNEPWEPQSRAERGVDALLSARGVPDAGDAGGGSPGPGHRPAAPASAPEPTSAPASEPEPATSAPEPAPTSAPAPAPTSAPAPAPEPEPASAPPRPALLSRALAASLALLHASAGTVAAWRRMPRSAFWRRPRRAVSYVIGLAVLATGVGLAASGLLTPDGRGEACAPPLELRVLTDPELESTVRAAADAYLTSDGNTTGDGCRRSGITVYSAGAADTVAALRRQTGAWQEPPDDDTNPQRDIGPQPDVWIPASRADADRVAAGQDTDAAATLEPADEPFAYSPIVLAVPQDLAADDYDARVGPPLNRMIDDLRARHPDARVRRPDPEFTDTGLFATIGLYGITADADAGTGTGPDAADLGRAERRVDQTGPPSPTAGQLLCTLPADDAVDDRTAALVPEFLLKSGVGCESERRAPRFAQYPGDVPGLEPLFVRVRWEDADRDEAARDEAAEDFRAWLAGERGGAVFARDGFRPVTGGRTLPDDESVADGVLRAPAPLVESAGRDAAEAALTGYQGANGPGRVLYLLDSSGSMVDLWEGPSGGPGLLKQSLGGLGDRDEYGVWAVSGLGERPYETLLPFGQHGRGDARRAVDERARVRDAEADPHAALLAALEEMERLGTDRPRLIVYVTDDEDVGRLTGTRLADVLARVRSVQVPVTTVLLEGAGCDAGRPNARVSAASGGRCIGVDEDLGAALRDEVARTGTGED